MDKLEKCIEYHNLFSTLSIKDSHMLKYKNGSLEEPDFEDSISLYTFMYFFGNMYKSFKLDLEKLPKFNLGKSFELWDYSNYGSEREITLIIDNPNIVNNDFCYLNIVENGNNIKCYLSTNDHEYYSRSNKIEIDKDFASKYLNFLEKYTHFIDCYNISNGSTMYSNSNPEALIINEYIGDLYDSLDAIKLKVMLDYHNKSYIADIIFDLNTLKIDYNKSNVDGIIENKEEAINDIVNKLYINKGRVVSSYSDTEEDKILRLKKGLDI